MVNTMAVEPLSHCAVEVLCYSLSEYEAWDDDGEQVYICGFIPAGTVLGCPKHRRLLAEVAEVLDD